VCAGSAAKVIGLTSNIFCNCRSPWNKCLADRILHHVIFPGSKEVRLAPTFQPSKSLPEEKIQHHKEPDKEDSSIHGGGLFLMPQSYGTVPLLSRTHNLFWSINEDILILPPHSNGLAAYERKGLFPKKTQYFRWICFYSFAW
jgi:hypothetical protein